MSVIEDFYPYRDIYGLIQFDPGCPSVTSDNGSLLTLEYLFLLSDQQKKAEIPRIKIVFKNLERSTENGAVTLRYPGCERTDSMDNATALVVFSYLFDEARLAKLLFNHGESTVAESIDTFQDQTRSLGFYPYAWIANGFKIPRRFYNTRPTQWSIQSWWGRSPGFMAVLEIAATGKTSLFRTVALLIGQFIPILFQKREDTSDKKLTYIVWQLLKTKNLFWLFLYKIWCVILVKKYSGGMKDIYEIYFGKEHPITKYSLEFLE